MEKIESKLGDVTRYYYKKPSSKQITDIKEFVERPYLQQRTLDNVNILAKNKYIENSLIKGELPKLKRVQSILLKNGIKASDSQVAKAVSTLGQLWRGDKFQNKITFDQNKKLGNTIYKLFEKLDNTNPYAREMYNIALEEISLAAGNKKGDFRKWKSALNKELRRLGVPIYKPAQAAKYNAKGKLIKKAQKAIDGFNVNEVTSIKASARNNIHTYAYFVDLTKGDINQKTLARFQGEFSKTLTKVDKLLAEGKNIKAREIINTWNTDKVPNFKSVIEKKHGIEAANNLNLPEIKYGTKIDPKIYTSSQLKKYKNYGIDIEGMAKDKKFYVDVKKAVPIQDLMKSQKQLLNLIKSIGCPNVKAGGGRIEFSEGKNCFDKGQKIINDGFKGASPAAMKNGAKFLNSAYRFGRNVMKFGIIPEAIFVGGETLLRSLGDQTLEEGLKSSIGFYTDWTGLTNLKKDARISQNMRNMGVDATMNIERLINFNDATDKVNKLKQMKESNLAVNDESLTGLTDQEVAANADKNIAKAQEYLDKNFLKEREKLYFSQLQDEAADIAGTKSPFQKFLGEAKNKTENMRYEPDFTGMQSDMLTIDPMSAKAKKDSVSSLPPRSPLTGSKGETAFLNLSQLPMGPRMGSEIDALAKALQATGINTDAASLKSIQDYKKYFKI